MSYTPPAGNSVAFVWTGDSYTPPAWNAVAFSYGASGDVSLTASGGISLSGSAAISFSESFPINGAGSVSLGGLADLQQPTLWSGSLSLGGTGLFNVGRVFSARGKVALGGYVQVNSGRTLSCSGKVQISGGSAQFLRGVSFSASGGIVLSGMATLGRFDPMPISGMGNITLGGRARVEIQPKRPINSIFIKTSRQEVVINGMG